MIGNIFKRFGRKQHKYRVDITNDDTYSHVITFHLTSQKVFWILLFSFISIVCFTASIVMFSPLRYYLPGLDYVEQLQNIKSLKTEVDNLQRKVEQQDKMYKTLQIVIKDDFKQMEKFDSLFFHQDVIISEGKDDE